MDEERRLLYVAMTRARQELHLLAPVRFYVTQQAPGGDRYVHGARSRFLTEPVLATFERASWPDSPADATGPAAPRRGEHRRRVSPEGHVVGRREDQACKDGD